MLVHGETGGDGKILAVFWFGDEWLDIGASLLSAEYDVFENAIDGDNDAVTAEEKLSSGLVSGGDIKLEIGGRRVIVVIEIVVEEGLMVGGAEKKTTMLRDLLEWKCIDGDSDRICQRRKTADAVR